MSVPPPASDIMIAFCPPGPTSKISISSGKVCETPVRSTVTFVTLPVNPVTVMSEGYGEPGAASLIAIAPLLEKSPGVQAGVPVKVAVAVAVAVEVFVGVLVDVIVGVNVAVEVLVGVPVLVGDPGTQIVVMMCRAHPPLMLPKSVVASSRTYSDQVPFGFVPLNIVSGEAGPAGVGAGAGNVSVVVS